MNSARVLDLALGVLVLLLLLILVWEGLVLLGRPIPLFLHPDAMNALFYMGLAAGYLLVMRRRGQPHNLWLAALFLAPGLHSLARWAFPAQDWLTFIVIPLWMVVCGVLAAYTLWIRERHRVRQHPPV